MIQHAVTEQDMIELGRQAARTASAGGIWWLSGDLGAGKTHWTKGFVSGIGSAAEVTSPTFGLVHEYAGGRWPVFHFDFYRLQALGELLALGWDEYLDQDGVVVVEWGERFPEVFPAGTRQVRITARPDGSRELETREL